MMNRRTLTFKLAPALGAGLLAAVFAAPVTAWAADLSAPDMVLKVSNDTLAAIKANRSAQSGNVNSIIQLVDKEVMSHVDFARMTASAVGPAWRNATPEEKTRLQQEFKTLLARSYANAFTMANDKQAKVFPLRGDPNASDVVVRSQFVGGTGDPLNLDYRMAKTPGVGYGWKVYNVNIAGIWMIDSYKSQFSQVVQTQGISGLINALAAKNKANAGQ